MISLAEAIFVFTDELATDVVEGYLRMQSDEAGERERRRRRLASLLLDAAGHDPEAVAHARRARPLAAAPDAGGAGARGRCAGRGRAPARHRRARRARRRGRVAGATGSRWARPPGARSTERSGAAPAALGPTVPPGDASRSLRWARLTLSLVRRGVLPRERPTRAGDHLATLILLQDVTWPAARRARLAAARRAAGRRARAPARDAGRMARPSAPHPGVAAEFHVHPQTVRYRIAKLRELLGGDLDSPKAGSSWSWRCGPARRSATRRRNAMVTSGALAAVTVRRAFT